MRRPVLVAGAVLAAAVAACGPVAAGPATPAASEHHARAAAAPASAPRWPDRASYALDLAYDPRHFTIAGSERIAFRNVGPQPLSVVWLRAWANAFGGCAVARAHVTIRAGGTFGARRRDCTALEVRLARPLAPARRPRSPCGSG
jgi:hypothetical protein